MNITIDDLLNYVKTYNPEELEIIKKAYDYADYLHEGQKRQSGEPYITHPLSVAYILSEMHADRDILYVLHYFMILLKIAILLKRILPNYSIKILLI